MIGIAVFGDIHANIQATEATLQDIDAHAPDHLICLGDLVGYGARPNDVIELIRSRKIPVIMGNYDEGIGFDRDDCGCAYKDETERANGERSVEWTAANVSSDNKVWLQTLLPEYRLTVAGVRIRVVHGSPRRINEYLFEDRYQASLERIARSAECDVLVFGHTHKPWTRDIAGVRFINAGSVGKPKDGDPWACWTMLKVSDPGEFEVTFHRVEYDIATAAAAIRAEAGLPDVYASDIETGGANPV
jgi:putative phosphoesterase